MGRSCPLTHLIKMASIRAGRHTIEEVFRQAGFDFHKEAAADYLGGKPDFRRVKVGGLSFDALDEEIVIPYTADKVEVTVDGEVAQTFDVDLTDEDKELRKRSFEVAADANDPSA